MTVLRVVHATTFEYSAPVAASYNEARLTPSRGPGQRLLDSQVSVNPHTWMHDYVDYWGTSVTTFEVLAPHERLEIVASSSVELPDGPPREPGEGNSWDFVTGPVFQDTMAAYLADSETTSVPPEVADLARTVSPRGGDPDTVAQDVCRAIRDRLEYLPGVTTVHTTAREAWHARKGVCQDVSHLCLGALRALGIPARYVSGYLHPRPDAEVGETVEGESHAWIEWWAGGWRAFDPTNRAFVASDHVVLGRGREYRDVSPLKGVYAGTATSALDVTVRITRTA
ncbi:transglutaminase family protein [Luteimicrobium subarcticum]|uniref:Transglutaminase-like putative cysteine protease n=1 Tax=Luteimicrobium subarcticum TaxID=620910 RepID=A0A2M8WQZ4_9MICO|nr:transglutaminase family protein [Luteimicrobium subarcticum]PJI93348.1 transglutaminase-like putative cysteine protease [Luteimicrobium subarcticum]